MTKTLKQIVTENALILLKTKPDIKGKLYDSLIPSFERGLFIAAFQFCSGSKKQLSEILGISYESVKKKIALYDIKYLGTRPRDESHLQIIKSAYSFALENLAQQIEWAVLHYTFLYFFVTSRAKFLYSTILEQVELPLIAIAFAEGKTKIEAAAILGIDRRTLGKKMKRYNIRGR